ncbi:hypothetical protein [Pseudalkalibacillus hwajinpoensis]|uniref:hypothetical protein n=1 Tax=Guptibacillus hwajinpoensis TaxID=208199 RepID=UPI002AA5923E
MKKPLLADWSGRMLTARPAESEHPGAEITGYRNNVYAKSKKGKAPLNYEKGFRYDLPWYSRSPDSIFLMKR